VPELAVVWPVEENEHGGRMLWAGAWLVGGSGEEGEAIYSGRGGESTRHPVPAAVTGLRIRRWPNEGLEPEYVDVLDLAGVGEVRPEALDFERPQPFSRLVGVGVMEGNR